MKRDHPYLNATASGGPHLSLEHSPNRVGKDEPAFAAPSYTINQFCEIEQMSRSALYKLWEQGTGPRFYFVGNTRRITAQARLDYHRDREAAAAVEMAAKP
jgi:hypothetical protein